MEQYLDKMTAIMRDADRHFETSGGSTRHYMRDLFLPMMEAAGLTIVEATPAPQDVPVGPWKFEVHHDVGPEDCDESVTITDGKLVLRFEQHEDEKGELKIVDLLNSMEAKIWYENPDEVISAYLQEQNDELRQELKRVQEAQAGVWVKADIFNRKEIPAGELFIRFNYCETRDEGHKWEKETGNRSLVIDLIENGWMDVEYLAESPSLPVKEQVDWEAKFNEANQFIIDLAKAFGQEGLGYDDLKWSVEDFQNAVKEQAVDPLSAFIEWLDIQRDTNSPIWEDKRVWGQEGAFKVVLEKYTQSLQNKP